jgi:(p)ppGpp synthase/HD superfamily hydrolase
MHSPADLVRAFEFAARMHAPHRRKGPAGEPYINHTAEVARLLSDATDGRDTVLIIGGLLHDVLEDVPETPAQEAALADEIEREFGAEVLDLIREVTDVPAATEAERWQNQIDAVAHKSKRGKLLKIADKTSNLREIARDPPPEWSREHRLAYAEWGADVVAGCRGLNPALEAAFDEVYTEAKAKYSV